MKYSYEHRLVIVQRVKQGETIAHLSREYHINETQILAWVRMWDKNKNEGRCLNAPRLDNKPIIITFLAMEKVILLCTFKTPPPQTKFNSLLNFNTT